MTESTRHICMQGYARLLGLELELVSGSYREILAKKKKKNVNSQNFPRMECTTLRNIKFSHRFKYRLVITWRNSNIMRVKYQNGICTK